MDRPATPDDVEQICLSLPATELGVTWGDVPSYVVLQKPKPRAFVLYRKPRGDALNPETGEEFDDLLVMATPGAADKEALIQADGPFFTIDHFNRSNSVLVQQSRLAEITVEELREVITEAWRSVAPRSLVKEHFPDA